MSNLATALLGSSALVLLGTGCPSVGHKRVPADSFNYNEAIARSRNEQMLLNIVRLKYIELPDFLAVSSVITSYNFDRSVSASGTITSGGAPDAAGASGNLGYSERPTISYAPLAGREFSIRLLTPIPVDVLFGLGQSGWPTDLLLSIALESVNKVQNMSYGQVPSPGDIDRDAQFALERQKLERFQGMIDRLVWLGQYGLAEVLRDEETEIDEETGLEVHFEREVAERFRRPLEEFRELLELDPELDSFQITSRRTGRDKNEITIQTRSLLAIMSFLSHGTEVPAEHARAGRVVPLPAELVEEVEKRIPIRIRSSLDPPEDAAVAVNFRGRWFYIDDTDVRSKRTFVTVLALFQLQAPSSAGAAPLLTLPTGG